MNFEITESTGNVFEDLEFKDASQRLIKAELLSRIHDLIQEKRLTEVGIEKILKIDSVAVSDLLKAQLGNFTVESLLTFLSRLDQKVEILVKDKPKSQKHHIPLMIAFA